MTNHLRGIDGFKQEGAVELARMVRQFWKDRGYLVETRLDVERTKHGGVVVVRSDMVNGLPR